MSLLADVQAQPAIHALIEWLAYFAAARVYFRARQREPLPLPLATQGLLLGCALFGAALGAIGLHDLACWSSLPRHPASTWIAGKSVLGGLLGGTVGTELGKRWVGYATPTGDAWVPALAVGLIIGRLGCQLAGPWDMTYGVPTGLGLGWNYGDGVPRYPTALIELLAVGGLYAAVRAARPGPPGQRFNRFLLGYCGLRVALEFLKPPYGAAAYGAASAVGRIAGLTAIQWAALAGGVWMTARLIHPYRKDL